MKSLSKFLQFNIDSFLTGKTLEVTGVKENIDYNTKAHLGTKVEVVIIKDKTVYPKSSSDEPVTNQYERFNVKFNKDITNVKIGDIVELINPVGVVYGDYRNQLSVTAEDIKVVNQDAPKSTQTPLQKRI